MAFDWSEPRHRELLRHTLALIESETPQEAAQALYALIDFRMGRERTDSGMSVHASMRGELARIIQNLKLRGRLSRNELLFCTQTWARRGYLTKETYDPREDVVYRDWMFPHHPQLGHPSWRFYALAIDNALAGVRGEFYRLNSPLVPAA